MTFLTKAICRRAGLDYDEVIVERRLSRGRSLLRRPKAVAGYGVHFCVTPTSSTGEVSAGEAMAVERRWDGGVLSEMLHDATESWNLQEAAILQLTHAAFEGWALGHMPGDFIYFSRPVQPLPQGHEINMADALNIAMEYQPAPQQGEALDRFLAALPAGVFPPGLSISKGAIRITYFHP
ncbi:MAG TPA: hypothetical protein VND94_05815 [Terriglobia bacterium]|nr:hypothetical protein [Terriglobia bacterium]